MFEAELPQSREAHWLVTLSRPQVNPIILSDEAAIVVLTNEERLIPAALGRSRRIDPVAFD